MQGAISHILLGSVFQCMWSYGSRHSHLLKVFMKFYYWHFSKTGCLILLTEKSQDLYHLKKNQETKILKELLSALCKRMG